MTEEEVFEPRDKIIYVGFLILIVWLPLPFGSNRPWAWSIMEVWVFLLTALWLLAFMFNKVKLTVSFTKARPVVLLFCLWLAWILFQIMPLPHALVEMLSPESAKLHATIQGMGSESNFITLSVDPHATKVGWLKSFAYVLVFFLALLLIRTQNRLRTLASVIILSGLFQAAFGSIMTLSDLHYGFFIKAVSNNVTGTFISRTHLAGYLVMCLSVGIGIMIANLDDTVGYSFRQRVVQTLKLLMSLKLRLRLYLVIMVIALVLTHSRMGNASFFVSLIIAGGIGLLLSRHATRNTIILLVSLIVIDIMIVGTWFGLEHVVERIEQTSFEVEQRDEAIIYALEQWRDYKLTGSGLGSFYTVFPKYRKKDIEGYFDHTHNDYLEFGTETGIIGIGLLGLVVVWSLLLALITQYKTTNPLMRGISFAVIMSIIAMLMHATVDFNLQIPSNAATFILILAMAWLSSSLRDKDVFRNEPIEIKIH